MVVLSICRKLVVVQYYSYCIYYTVREVRWKGVVTSPYGVVKSQYHYIDPATSRLRSLPARLIAREPSLWSYR